MRSLPYLSGCAFENTQISGILCFFVIFYGFAAESLRTFKSSSSILAISKREHSQTVLIFHALQNQSASVMQKEVAGMRIRSDCSKLLWKKNTQKKTRKKKLRQAPCISRTPIQLAELLVKNQISLFVIDRRLCPITF